MNNKEEIPNWEGHYLYNKDDVLTALQEIQRRYDFEYAWQGRRGGNTCTPRVAQIWYEGEVYMATSEFATPITEVSVHDKP